MRNPNRLINENSPYLLKHAYNLVDWWPWCKEAFEKAKKENKPIFLSIGYSTCHWCHVMEYESFEDSEVSALINKYFIPIKVDREQRPDIDSLYIKISNMLRGNSGWPLTVITTPDGKPFFVSTYIPKESEKGRTGLIELLKRIHKLWVEQKEMLIQNCDEILSSVSFFNTREVDYLTDIKNLTYDHLNTYYDEIYGGFGHSPKFPMPHNILFLLELKNDDATKMALNTLDNMCKGGIFDHLIGGFARYSTDDFWLIPHFEKMLYDNALLLSAYTKGYELTKRVTYKKVATKIINYVMTELKDSRNFFYSAQDADVEGVEGRYYLFSEDEIINVLGFHLGTIFNKTYGITKDGNFKGLSVPNLLGDHLPLDEEVLKKVYLYRKQRYQLKTDDKIITSWNCLMISSLAEASKVFKNELYLNFAKHAFDSINRYLRYKDSIFTSYRDGKRSGYGFLDDYAFYIYCCIKLYQVTLENHYIDNALNVLNKTIEKFLDKDLGCFYFNTEKEGLLKRPIETYDGALPSSNSVMYYNLVFLSNFTDDINLYNYKNNLYKFLITQNPSLMGFNSFFAYSLCFEELITKVVCVPKDDSVKIDISEFKDFDVVKIISNNKEYPLLNNDTTYYVCKGQICFPPNNDLEINNYN